MNGIIKVLNEKGFGFISREGEEKDLFFHKNDLAEGIVFEELREGQEVTFSVEVGPKGPNAKNVKLVV